MPLTEADVKEAVLAAASTNSSLLVKLAETEDAPGSLALHLKNTSRLQADLQEQYEALEKLREETEAKLRFHKKYNNSPARKFLYKASFMSVKFGEKAVKGEQEYFSVLAEQSKAEDRHKRLQSELDGAEEEESALQAKAEEHDKTHSQIDELYDRLFAGPTPGFDREDSLENRFYSARGNHDGVKAKITTSRQAARYLKIALRNLKKAYTAVDTASIEVSDSLFSFDIPAYSLSQSNNSLDYASSAVLQAVDTLLARTPGLESSKSNALRALRQAKTPSDIPRNRNAFRTAIATSQERIQEAQTQVEKFLALTHTIETSGLEELKKTARTLEDARQALHQSRMGIFEEVAGFGQAAPAYNECCDRADAFCELPPPPVDETDEDEPIGGLLPDYEEFAAVSLESRVAGAAPVNNVEAPTDLKV